MATYYASFIDGNDANNGLGPDASAVTNKPWKTLTKALGAAGMASGDTLYLSPAGPFREVVTVAMTSAGAETLIIGDYANAQGFKTSGGALVSPGQVMATAYLTNDTTTPSTSSLLTLAARDFLTFRNIVFMGGNTTNSCVNAAAGSTNIKFTDCLFFTPAGNQLFCIAFVGTADTAATWLIDRCTFNIAPGGFGFVSLNIPGGAGAPEYSVGLTIRNSLFVGGATGIYLQRSGGTGAPFGAAIEYCNVVGASAEGIRFLGTWSSSTPSTIYNCLVIAATALSAAASGQVTEDYNILQAFTTRSNVSAGTHSVVAPTYAPAYEADRWRIQGRAPVPFYAPVAGSNQFTPGTGIAQTVDILNRPRPGGGGVTNNAVGAYERHEAATQETSVVDAGSSGLKFTGPGDHDLVIPVNAAATVIAVKVRYDTNHGTGTKPQAILLDNAAIGVTTETKTATVGVDTWENLVFSTFTPTAKGFVTVRLVSRAAAGSGLAYFDTATVPSIDTEGFDYFRNAEPFPAITGASSGGLKTHPGMGGGARG